MYFLYLIVLVEILGLRYQRYISFTLRCFQLLVQLVHCSRLGCATALVASLFALLVCPPCLPACIAICLTDVSYIFIDPFFSLDHLLHLIISPPCLIISWGSPPCCSAQHLVSYSQNRRAPLPPPSSTLSTGLTFFNTFSLNFILGLFSFNLHHIIIGVACSGVQRFPPKYTSLRVNLGIHLQSRFHHQVSHSALDPCYQNVYFSLSIQPTCGAQAHIMLTTISSNPSSIVITGSLFLFTLVRSFFSSLDSTIAIPHTQHHSTLARLYHYGATCSLPNYFALYPFHLFSYTHNKPTFLVSIISAKLFPFPVTVPTFKLPTLMQ